MAAPLTTVDTTKSATIDPGEAVFDPEEQARRANEKYESKLREVQDSNEAEIRRIQQDSDARTQSMRDEIDVLRREMVNTRNTPPPEPQISLEDKYRISDDDKDNYGDMIPVMDARAGLLAEKAATAAFNQASQLFSSREEKLTQELDNLKRQVEAANNGVSQNFDASARARAANYGLELETLNKNEDWNRLMEQPISPVNDMTYNQYVTQSVQTQDMRGLESVFKYFAEDFQRPSGSTLTGLPNGGVRNPPSDGGVQQKDFTDGGSIIAELDALDERKMALRDDITRRRISIEEFSAKNEELDNKIIALRRKLN